MCGRSSVNVSAEYIAIEANRACGTVGNVTWNARTRDHWVPRSNIHPGQLLPVIIRDAESGELYLEAVHWGLIPSFTPSDLKKPDFFRMFNSRSETCAELPSFRRLTTNQRCVVLLSG
jgi:putative SOS response-associated peptidase YedK